MCLCGVVKSVKILTKKLPQKLHLDQYVTFFHDGSSVPCDGLKAVLMGSDVIAVGTAVERQPFYSKGQNPSSVCPLLKDHCISPEWIKTITWKFKFR